MGEANTLQAGSKPIVSGSYSLVNILTCVGTSLSIIFSASFISSFKKDE